MFVFYAFKLQRRRQQHINRLLKLHQNELQHGQWFSIRYADAKRFRRWIKFFPWERVGILHIANGTINVYLDDDSIVSMPAGESSARWIGQNYWPNGALNWFGLQHKDQTYFFTADTGMTIINSRQKTISIFNQIAADMIVTNPAPFDTAFAIEKNPHALFIVVVFFIFLFYYLVDNFFILSEEYVTWPAKIIFVSAGVMMLLASYFYMLRNHVPKIESTVIAILLCCASVFALYPGLRRISQLIDSENAQQYRYTFSETRLLIPDEKDLPRLTMATRKQDHAFWEQYKSGDHYDVKLRHSALGFYQIDMEPIYAQMRDFYRRQQELKQQANSE